MLTDLRVQGLGVIEDLSIAFGPGMTALTGETGAGKTLVVEALSLVLGGRGAAGLVRAGASEALVEARFTGAARAAVWEPADDPDAAAGPDGDGAAAGSDQAGDGDGDGSAGDELVLTRSVSASGRSRAWVDGRMVPVSRLAEIGAALVDIHGQHEHQSLVRPGAQRQLLDTFSGADPSAVEAVRRRLAAIDRRLAALGGDEHARARAADVLRHQVREIDAASLDDPDEEAALTAEADRLSDLDALRQAAALAVGLLDGGGDGGADGGELGPGQADAASLLGRAVAALGGREAMAGLEQRLRGVAAEITDAVRELRDAAETWEDDPARLAEVQDRRRLLADLRRKYGQQLSDVMAFGRQAAEELRQLESAEETAAGLAAERRRVAAELGREEEALRKVRAGAAGPLAAAVEGRLRQLAMPGARLEVEVAGTGAGEPVQLRLGANVGEPVQPLAKVASGGELARAMLALRLVASGGPSTMVFDEVDAGVGGAAALALGRALREVAAGEPAGEAAGEGPQVLVVTHLAQVAACADAQVALRKEEAGGRTTTSAASLDQEARVVELSRMLSGQPDSAAARATAEELLTLGRRADLSTTGAATLHYSAMVRQGDPGGR